MTSSSVEKTLMVTPYAPYRDGIAAYAVQEVRQKRMSGESIEVLSPKPSAAQHHLALGSVRGAAALVKKAAHFDRIVIQFFPEMIFGRCSNPVERVLVWAILSAIPSEKLEIRVHEIEYGPLRRNPLERKAAAFLFQKAASVFVHTKAEQDELSACLKLEKQTIGLFDHGEHFVPAAAISKEEAREQLGLKQNEHLFLCIGFVQEHKGFHLAVKAFQEAAMADSSLHVVGSTRVDAPDLVRYAKNLKTLVNRVDGAFFHHQYLSDYQFDVWIQASDTVVVPYQEIWSSGVLERAKMFDKPVIASDVGGIGDQIHEGSVLFSDYPALAKAFETQAVGKKKRKAVRAKQIVKPAALEDIIRSRARKKSGDSLSLKRKSAGEGVEQLFAVGPLHRPEAVSARPGVSTVKRFIRRLTNWQIEPVAAHVEALQSAVLEAAISLEDQPASEQEAVRKDSKKVKG